MSTWTWSKEFIEASEGQMVCQICGKEPDAVWTGQKEVVICLNCALNVLPKLIADAVANRRVKISVFKTMWEEAEKNFWYATACQLAHSTRQENKSHDNA